MGVLKINQMAAYVQYLAAGFELFVGANFIFTPEALLDGHKPASGMQTLICEWFGCACILFGISLIISGASMRLPNLLYQLFWACSLGSTFLKKPWRPESAVTDGSWAL